MHMSIRLLFSTIYLLLFAGGRVQVDRRNEEALLRRFAGWCACTAKIKQNATFFVGMMHETEYIQ